MNKEERIQQFKTIGIRILWVVMVVGLFVSLAFAGHEQKQTTCTAVDVRIRPEKDNFFVDRNTVIHLITNEGQEGDLIGKSLAGMDVSELEQRLERNPFIWNAEVFTSINGELNVKVYQRKPLIRIAYSDGSGYYIDDRGMKMPLSDQFTARVPVATGNIYEKYEQSDSLHSFVTQELYRLAVFVNNDEFWKAQIEQVYVDAKSELVLVPKVGAHVIMLGTTENMEEKFNRLMIFYKEGLSKVGWNTYKTINLKYEGQIICSRK